MNSPEKRGNSNIDNNNRKNKRSNNISNDNNKEFEVHKAVMQILSGSWVRASELAHVLYINIASSLQLSENKIYSYLFLLYIRKDEKGYQLPEVETAKKGGTWYLRKSASILTNSFPYNLSAILTQAFYTPPSQIPLMQIEEPQNPITVSRIPEIRDHNYELNSRIQQIHTDITPNDTPISMDTSINTSNITNDKAESVSLPLDDDIPVQFNLKNAEFYTVEEARLDAFYMQLQKKMKVFPNKYNTSSISDE